MQEKKRKNRTLNVKKKKYHLMWCNWVFILSLLWFSRSFTFYCLHKNKKQCRQNFAFMIFIYGSSVMANAECHCRFRGLHTSISTIATETCFWWIESETVVCRYNRAHATHTTVSYLNWLFKNFMKWMWWQKIFM